MRFIWTIGDCPFSDKRRGFYGRSVPRYVGTITNWEPTDSNPSSILQYNPRVALSWTVSWLVQSRPAACSHATQVPPPGTSSILVCWYRFRCLVPRAWTSVCMIVLRGPDTYSVLASQDGKPTAARWLYSIFRIPFCAIQSSHNPPIPVAVHDSGGTRFKGGGVRSDPWAIIPVASRPVSTRSGRKHVYHVVLDLP